MCKQEIFGMFLVLVAIVWVGFVTGAACNFYTFLSHYQEENNMCYYCGHDIDKEHVDGCIKHRYFIDGKWHTALKVGSVGDVCDGKGEAARCPDCGAMVGTFHHDGCEQERCPVCGGKWISCEDGKNEEIYRSTEVIIETKKVLHSNRFQPEEKLKKIEKIMGNFGV